MPADDPSIKTSFRVPRSVLDAIENSAARNGMTINGEVVYRLSHDPREDSAGAVLAEFKRMESAALGSMERQLNALWTALERSEQTFAHVLEAMALVNPDSDAAALKREVEFARELINALSAHR